MTKQKKSENCPCDTGLPFEQCCLPLLNGTEPASSALALMRSRFSAYVLADESYLLKTWHSDTRPQQLDLDQREQQWKRLKIVDTELGQADDETGIVEFIATFKINGRAEHLHERSRFSRQNGQWVYLDGVHHGPNQL
ncbi:MAG: YchJ family metal-binding protein [Pseudomonadales bacterium]|nr:YchJ family metal-binding protein [Pseudomonadales bacterium]